MSDEVVVEEGGFLERLKSACMGVVIGLGLFVVAFPVIFWMEGRYVRLEADIGVAEGALEGRSGKADELKAEWEGKFVHVTGTAETGDVLSDPEFGVSVNALRLARTAEMYQWDEHEESEKRGKKRVKVYTYEKDWFEGAIDHRRFKEPAGHENPDNPYRSDEWSATNVAFGKFELSTGQIGKLGSLEPLRLDGALAATPASTAPVEAPAASDAAPAAENVCPECGKELKSAQGVQDHMKAKHGQDADEAAPAEAAPAEASGALAGGFKRVGDTLYRGHDPSSPQVGDVRVTFEYTPPAADASFLAQQVGNRLQPFMLSTGRTWDRQEDGIVDAPTMFENARSENTLWLWLGRIGGFLMMFIGLSLFFRPLAVVADVIPILGDLINMGFALAAFGIAAVCSLMTIAVGWLFYRPLFGIPLVVLALGILVGLIVMARGKKAATPAV